MSGKLLVLIVFIWVIGMFLGSTFENHSTAATWAGSGTGGLEQSPQTTLSYLLNFSNATQHLTTAGLGTFSLPWPNPDYFKTWFQVLTWQFYFTTTSPYDMFYWVFLLPFCVLAVVSMVMLTVGIVRGNITFGNYLFVIPPSRQDFPVFNKKRKTWKWVKIKDGRDKSIN